MSLATEITLISLVLLVVFFGFPLFDRIALLIDARRYARTQNWSRTYKAVQNPAVTRTWRFYRRSWFGWTEIWKTDCSPEEAQAILDRFKSPPTLY